MTWGILFSTSFDESEYDILLIIKDIVIIMTALIGSMYLLMDETLKSDINSNWLNYSYTLPIKPYERTTARFVRRFSVCFANLLISIINAIAICFYTDGKFSANYIVWHIVILTIVTLISLPNDIFMTRARSEEDVKKMRTFSGMMTTALMVVMVFIIFKATGISFEMLANEDAPPAKLPVFTAMSLLWAVPSVLVIITASFFASYHGLKSAYSNTAKPEKKDNEINSKTAPAIQKGITKGLLYKELKQNKNIIILAVLTPIIFTAFPFCFSAIEVMTNNIGTDEVFETATNIIIRLLMYVAGMFTISGLMSEVFNGDDKKLWAYFIISVPQGVKGFLYRKYAITFMINIIYMASGFFADNLLATVHYFVTGNEIATNMQMLYLYGVFMLMGISAVDIPFMVRYGSKKGSIVKIIVMLSVCIAGVALFNILPEEICTKIIETAVSIFNGDKVNDWLMLILSISPYIALMAFLYSYRISYKVFIKGVNEYDK